MSKRLPYRENGKIIGRLKSGVDVWCSENNFNDVFTISDNKRVASRYVEKEDRFIDISPEEFSRKEEDKKKDKKVSSDELIKKWFSGKSIFIGDPPEESPLQPALQRVSPCLKTPIHRYDDIVDRSHFNVGTGQIEDDYNGVSSMEPRYDYKKGFIPKSDPVTPTIMALRSGRLNQADISQLERALEEFARTSADEDSAKEAKEAQKAIDNARQEVLDEAIGFDKKTVSTQK